MLSALKVELSKIYVIVPCAVAGSGRRRLRAGVGWHAGVPPTED
jgi:hypothetical protein